MRKIAVSQLTPGMVISKDVYNYNSQLILSEGLVLNDKSITKLAFYSIPFVFIEETSMENQPAQEVPQSYSERVKSSPEYQKFSHEFEAEVGKIKGVLNDVVEKNAPLEVDDLLHDTLSLLQNTHGSIHIFDILHNMRSFDDMTYAHSINVSLICNVLATWLGMSEDDVFLATQCGLLHDIGKLTIPEDIIKKPAKLTDQEYMLIKTHPAEGYKILTRYNLNPHIANAALMHHERCDGSGYPNALHGDQIDIFAKIVSIADVYDAMTSARVYRGPLCPFKVIAVFESEGLQKYDTKCIMTFMENVLQTYILNQVRLSDGRTGEVVLMNRQAYSRPLVRCGSEYVDLSKSPSDLTIEEIL